VLDRERLDVVAALRLREQLLLRDVRLPTCDLGVRARGRERSSIGRAERAQRDVLALDRHAAIIGA
jgi:hypothetical protein